jgi:hypothetical protein
VIHKSSNTKYSSDCDILAIRPPHVYEEIGGGEEDLDTELTRLGLDLNRTLGVICEVKTGYVGRIFRRQNVYYAIDRLGFVGNSSAAKETLREHASCLLGKQYQIAKLLIANKQPRYHNRFLFVSLEQTRDFIRGRMKKYSDSKFRDRIFFNSTLMQYLIWEAELERLASASDLLHT